jgi:hypothetical protein
MGAETGLPGLQNDTFLGWRSGWYLLSDPSIDTKIQGIRYFFDALLFGGTGAGGLQSANFLESCLLEGHGAVFGFEFG